VAPAPQQSGKLAKISRDGERNDRESLPDKALRFSAIMKKKNAPRREGFQSFDRSPPIVFVRNRKLARAFVPETPKPPHERLVAVMSARRMAKPC